MRFAVVVVALFVVGCGSSSGGGGGGGSGGTGGGGSGGAEGALMFGPQTAIPTASGRVVATGDVNKDAKADLVVGANGAMGNGGNALLNSGTATFTVGAAFSTVAQPSWIALGDLDGDGDADIIAALGQGAPGGNIALLQGNGAGLFSMASGVAGELNPVAVVTGDFNQDGKLDAATVNATAASMGASVFLVGKTTHDNYTVGKAPGSIGIADWNGDGQPDLAVGGGDSTGGNLTVLLGKPGGSFNVIGMIPFAREIQAIGAGDFDGDGKLDLVVGTGGGDVVVALGRGDGTFTQGAPVHALFDLGAVEHLEVADFNGGGRLDVATLVVPGAGQAYVTVLLGNGNGTLQAPIKFGGFDTGGITADSLTSGDYDGDGKRDLVVAHGTVDLFINRSN